MVRETRNCSVSFEKRANRRAVDPVPMSAPGCKTGMIWGNADCHGVGPTVFEPRRDRGFNRLDLGGRGQHIGGREARNVAPGPSPGANEGADHDERIHDREREGGHGRD